MLPKISVITATYNSEATLRKTLDSLGQQTYRNFEHVVVDGLSTDGTLDVIRDFGVRGAIVDSSADNGIYDALNRGIGLATGDVVGFLHSDDFYATPHALGKIAEAFEDASVDLCYGDLVYVKKDDVSSVVRRWRAGRFRASRLKFGWMPPHPTVYVRRELLQKYPFDLQYRISGDYDAMLRLLKSEAVGVGYIPQELICMRLGGASNKSLTNISRKMREDWRAIRSNNVGGLVALVSKNLTKLPQFFRGSS